MKNVLVQFLKQYLILRPRKCQKHECRRYPRSTPLCPQNFEFRKMQIFIFRYLCEECFSTVSKTISHFAVVKNLKNMNVTDTPFSPFKIKILQNPFLAHLYAPISVCPQNFMSLTLIVSAGLDDLVIQDILSIIPPFYPFVPLKIRISKNAVICFQVFL